MAGFARLQEEVIGTGLCMFCGSCVGVCPSKCLTTNYELEEPESVKACPPQCQICYEVCPGKDIPMPEMHRMLFGREPNAEEEVLGISRYFVRAWSTDPWIRGRAASGGLCTALTIYALEKGIIDAAILTGADPKKPWLAPPVIATNRMEVIACQYTKNVRAPTNAVLTEALDRGYKKLGIVGMPSHIHAIRKMQLEGKLTKLIDSIKFVIGVFAAGGSASSRIEHEHLIEEVLGVPLNEVSEVILHGHAYPGLYAVLTKDGRILAVRDGTRHLHWRGYGNDRVGYDGWCELADVLGAGYFGVDARRGVSGMSLGIVRTEFGEKLMKDAEAAGYIKTELVKKENIFKVTNARADIKLRARERILELQKFGHAVPDYHIPAEVFKRDAKLDPSLTLR